MDWIDESDADAQFFAELARERQEARERRAARVLAGAKLTVGSWAFVIFTLALGGDPPVFFAYVGYFAFAWALAFGIFGGILFAVNLWEWIKGRPLTD